MELRDVDIARRYILQGLCLQRVIRPTAAFVGPAPPRGLSAAVFVVLAWVLVGVLITILAGRIFESWFASAPAIGIALMLFGPFMATTLSNFTRGIFDRIVAIGGS